MKTKNSSDLEYTITRREGVTHETDSFYLEPADGSPPAPFRAGQAIRVRSGRLSRDCTYSLSSRPGLPWIRITVKRSSSQAEAAFGCSGTMHNLQAGETVAVSPPAGSFVRRSPSHPAVLLSAGIGITPFIAMIAEADFLHAEAPIMLMHGARNGAEDPSRALLRGITGNLRNFRKFVAYSAPLAQDAQGVDYDMAGRLTAEAVLRQAAVPEADFYLCGPTSFLAQMRDGLIKGGISPGNIHQETFGTPNIPGVPGEVAAKSVNLERSNRTLQWDGGQGTLLELVEANGLTPDYFCRAGICHTCKVSLLRGSVEYVLPVSSPPGDGEVLICCARPLTDIAIGL